jgi:outer membrane protein OmpA-like peptidoglycan-associated protein
MKRVLIAAIVALAAAFSISASAQEWWNGAPQGRFNGFEVGVQGGYGWGTSSGNLVGPFSGLPHYNFSTNGGMGGGHLGYDLEMPPGWTLGLEGDIEGGDIGGRFRDFARDASVGSSMDFDASIRGRVGWTFGPQTLLYATGGAAFGDVTTHFNDPIGFRVAGNSEVRVGWTAGVGLTYALTQNWESTIEYRYTDLGTQTQILPVGISNTNLFRYNMFRVGLTYRFAPPPPPPPAPQPVAAPAPPPVPPPRTFLVFFDFDRYNLTVDARRVIEAAAAAYKASGSALIDVAGYTDLAGTQAYNLRLSQRRADGVAGYLARQGVPRDVMDVKWFGKENPRVPTADGVREPQNRRVEIEMH